MTEDLLTVALDHHRAGRSDEARRFYEVALKADPNRVEGLYFLGFLHSQIDEDHAAVPLFQKAILLSGGNAEMYVNLGHSLRRLGRVEEALFAFRFALAQQLDSQQPVHNEASQMLDVVRIEQAAVDASLDRVCRGAGRGLPINIYIKAHSRPFYLDRCIRTIKRHITGYGSIIVLNDGMGPEIVERLKTAHPDIDIRNSPKVEYGVIAAPFSNHPFFGTGRNSRALPPEKFDPARFWTGELRREPGSHFFIMEEDIAITRNIDFGTLSESGVLNDLAMLSFRWMGQDGHEVERNFVLPDGQEAVQYRIQDLSRGKKYSIFPILCTIFHKEYWTHAHWNTPDWWAEDRILDNAAQLYTTASLRGVPLLKSACVKQTAFRHFLSTTARDDGGGPGVTAKIPAHVYNDVLNQFWLDGELDCMHNDPDDFPLEYLLSFFRRALSETEVDDWLAWRREYLRMYGHD
jgi:hypothetical protein